MTVDYQEFLAQKALVVPNAGIEVTDTDVHPSLFPFQRDLVRWALKKGRAAIFADTGLGKSRMQLEWARLVNVPTLILAPLAVARQTVQEAARIGVPITYARSQTDVTERITITNYEMLDHFDIKYFGAIVLDESSILKNFEGKTRTKLITIFANTPYRLCCTATPAPNDISEIGNHAEFLGIMTDVEMRAAFFIHTDEGWRLRKHAKRGPFYRWMASWAMSVRTPSDLGYSDDGYTLPGLDIKPQIVPSAYVPEGRLFHDTLKGVGERAQVRKATITARVDAAAALVAKEPDEQWLCWVGMNDEGEELAKLLPGAVVVEGNQSPEEKAEKLAAFAAGDIRILITKSRIAGFGMNFQRCARMVFVGMGDSYEQYYQSIRRCYRFGQKREVVAHIVLTDIEEEIYQNVLRKEKEAKMMAAELIAAVATFEQEEITNTRGKSDYTPTVAMRVPAWLQAA